MPFENTVFMRKVIGIGETVLDIIFRNGQPTAAVPGGSTYNAIISLARCGVDTTFISEVGDDRVGDEIINFLKENGAKTDYVSRFPQTKSPISLAFLNENNDAEYIFYKDHPNDRLEFECPDIQPDDIILFGSYYALNPVIRTQVAGLLEEARHQGAIIYYDVNFRPSHQHEAMKLMPNLLENLDYADFVRGSNEDFEVLYQKSDVGQVYDTEISFYCNHFIYTRGANPVEVRGKNSFKHSYPVPASEQIVSTIGAGDNFNAGFIFGLLKYGITREVLDQGMSADQWADVVSCAQQFSAECCRDIHNYVSVEFAQRIK